LIFYSSDSDDSGIGITESSLENHQTSLGILSYCAEYIDHHRDFDDSVLPTKIYLNAAYMNHRTGNDSAALYYAEKGIAYNVNNEANMQWVICMAGKVLPNSTLTNQLPSIRSKKHYCITTS